MECAGCDQAGLGAQPRWKAPLLFVGTLLVCPCHLPATFGVVAAIGGGLTGAGWLFENQAMVYVAFSLVYLALLFFFVRWVMRSRDRDRRRESEHAAHAPA